MKITIDDELCKQHNIPLEELLVALAIKMGGDILTIMDTLLQKEVIVRPEGEFLLTKDWSDTIDTVLLDSDLRAQPVTRLEKLVIKLQALFPEGKKDGTTQYWRGNKREISLRLKKFFKLYGDEYTDEEILSATKRYVENFNGLYGKMRILKYFIWKDEKKISEDGSLKIMETSDLATLLENKDSSQNSDLWTLKIV